MSHEEQLNNRILVVEDEAHIQRLLRIILEKHGYHVESAETGEEAVAVLQTGPRPNLILLDIMMPGMDGIEVLEKIREMKPLREVDVVMLTSMSQQDMVIKGARLGVKDFIAKPFQPKEFIRRISPILPAPTSPT
ncbi:MAG: response regulator [Zetaproteobacteria bacterium]|nr:response regulator [Zetaproteobacteria bacterium]